MQINKQTIVIDHTQTKEIQLQPLGVFKRSSRFAATHNANDLLYDPTARFYYNATKSRRKTTKIIPFPSLGLKDLRQEERGSIVLEAAMVLPIFLFVSIFLVYIVQMTLVSTALHNVTSDTTRYVASHMYPAKEATKAIQESKYIPKLSLTEMVSKYENLFPSPLDEWIMDAAKSGDIRLKNLKNQMIAAALDEAIMPLIKQVAADNKLDYDRIHVTSVDISGLSDASNPYFGIEVSYELPFSIPLVFKPIVLQSKATERLWIGDTGEFGAGAAAEAEEASGVKVVSVPQPAHPESLISIAATASPGSRVKLEVMYKSGTSTAKGLGEAVADSEGNLNWTWKIPSSAAAGWASYVLTTADGEQVHGTFQIVSYDGRPVIPDATALPIL